jgi:hypothetical protein
MESKVNRHTKRAEDHGDKSTVVPVAELYLLRQVAARSSDFRLGLNNIGFAAHCGGLDHLRQEMELAIQAYEQWINDGQG